MKKSRFKGLQMVIFAFLVLCIAKCQKAEELVGPEQEPATPEIIYEGDKIVYLKAWDTVKTAKLLVVSVSDTTKPAEKPKTQSIKKKKAVFKKKRFRSLQDRENAEFEEWYRKRHKNR